jgi:signal transduction histidine kinase
MGRMDRMAPAVRWAGLCLAVAGVLGPLLASWSALPDGARVALLACGPLASAGFAAAAAWWGTGAPVRRLVLAVAASVAASVALMLGYNPFLDPSCSVVCVDLPAPVPALSSRGSAAASAIALSVTAVVTHHFSPGLDLRRRPQGLVAFVSTAVMALAFGGWALWWGDAAWQSIRLWTPPVLAGVLAAVATAGEVVGLRRRRRLDRLVEALSDAPSAARLESAALVPELLTPEQRLGLGIAALKTELGARVDEVRASQERIVNRSDSERRRIGADLHDGAQQQLVAAALQLRIAASASDADAAVPFESAESAILEALQRVRRLSHSIYPAYLAAEGLEPALRELVAEMHGAVRLELMLPQPVPESVAVAVFIVVEAVVRHSSPNDSLPLTVAVVEADGELILETNVPAGMDARALVHLRDRVAAVGGTMGIEGIEGIEGSRAKVVIPCG